MRSNAAPGMGMTVQTGNIAGVALAEQTLESWNRIMEVNYNIRGADYYRNTERTP